MKKKTTARVSVPLDCLVRLTVQERLSAAAMYYAQHDARFAEGLRHAVEIAAPDGWQHIAPAWAKWIKPNAEHHARPEAKRKDVA